MSRKKYPCEHVQSQSSNCDLKNALGNNRLLQKYKYV